MKRAFLVAAAVLVAAGLCVLALFLSLPRRTHVPVAVYDRSVMTVVHGVALELLTPRGTDEERRLADIFVRVEGNRTVSVRDLTRADAERLTGTKGKWLELGGDREMLFRHGQTMFVFDENQQLVLACFHEDTPIPLTTSPDGPFFTLPISKQRMIEIFGKPLRWDKSAIPGV